MSTTLDTQLQSSITIGQFSTVLLNRHKGFYIGYIYVYNTFYEVSAIKGIERTKIYQLLCQKVVWPQLYQLYQLLQLCFCNMYLHYNNAKQITAKRKSTCYSQPDITQCLYTSNQGNPIITRHLLWWSVLGKRLEMVTRNFNVCC